MFHKLRRVCWLFVLFFQVSGMSLQAEDWMSQVNHKYADSHGVKIHYAVAGSGPLVVFVHGFPDFWYSWQHQMRGLSSDFTVAAMDTRGYNLSDKPEGVEQYDMALLVADVAAVIESEQQDKATIVGHDWGGAIAWAFAAMRPDKTDKLIIVNLPHMSGLVRELMQENSSQHRNSSYARMFQREDSHKALNAQMLAGMVAGKDAQLRAKYVEAFEKSSLESMMNYYRRNYPREPYQMPEFPKIQAPVLQFHGLADTALLAPALNNTWDHLEQDWTLVTLPGVGHWSHHQAADKVTETMRWWLKMRK
ncbi:MAG: alpha/beta hydrolase [Pirellulaceae bacterium]|nr:alpha/beta hydrolase [Pirellulaceae bacterium]